MAIFNDFPYSNLHELNLDWLIKVVKYCEKTVDTNNQIINEIKEWQDKYADNITPKYLGEWQITKSYETMSIVEYDGDTYLSIDNIPANTPISDNRWIKIADFNYQLDEYKTQLTGYSSQLSQYSRQLQEYSNQLEQFSVQIDNFSDELKSANTKIENNTREINNSKQAIEQNANDIQDILTDITPLKNPLILFIGDSYGDNPRVTNTWCGECAAALKLTAAQYMNLCKSGASFAIPGSPHYIDQLEGFSGNRFNVTHIVLMGGTNDLSTDRMDILTAAEEMATYIKNNFVNAKYYVGFNSLTIGGAYTEHRYKTYCTFNSLGAYGFGVIPNALAVNHDYTHLEDGSSHPDEIANNKMGWALASFLMGGQYYYQTDNEYISCQNYEGYNITGAIGNTTVDALAGNGILELNRITILVNTPTEWANDSSHKIGKIISNFIKTNTQIAQQPINIAYADANFTWYNAYGTISFDNEGYFTLNTVGKFTPVALIISGVITVPLAKC